MAQIVGSVEYMVTAYVEHQTVSKGYVGKRQSYAVFD